MHFLINTKDFIKKHHLIILALFAIDWFVFGLGEGVILFFDKGLYKDFFDTLLYAFTGDMPDYTSALNAISEHALSPVLEDKTFSESFIMVAEMISPIAQPNTWGLIFATIYFFLLKKEQKFFHKKYIICSSLVAIAIILQMFTDVGDLREYYPEAHAMSIAFALPLVIVLLGIPMTIMAIELNVYNKIRDRKILKVADYKTTKETKSKFDILGLIAMVITNNGFTKTRTISPNMLKDPKKDTIKIETAAPIVFLGIAFVSYVIRMIMITGFDVSQGNYFAREFDHIGFYSIGLAVFMLMPIPSLPGFNILKAFFPSLKDNKYVIRFMNFKHRRWILILLAFLLNRNSVQLFIVYILHNIAFIFN